MIMFLAGLSSIPKEIYEAAEMDGASRSEQFFHITLPILRPVVAMIVLQGLISNVYSFNIVSMMFGNGAGFAGRGHRLGLAFGELAQGDGGGVFAGWGHKTRNHCSSSSIRRKCMR